MVLGTRAPTAGGEVGRLALEAERLQLSMRVKDGHGFSPFSAAHAHLFAPFPSVVRQQLLRSILEQPREAAPRRGVGAGLDLSSLLASGRLIDLIYLHQDEDADLILQQQSRGCTGCCRQSQAAARRTYEYLGAELGFYFSWAGYYTRCLWAPAALGLVVSALDYFLLHPSNFELGSGGGGAEPGSGVGSGSLGLWENGSGGGGLQQCFSWRAGGGLCFDLAQAARARQTLVVVYTIGLIMWAALFIEGWKRLAKKLALDWGLVYAPGKSDLVVHAKFHESNSGPPHPSLNAPILFRIWVSSSIRASRWCTPSSTKKPSCPVSTPRTGRGCLLRRPARLRAQPPRRPGSATNARRAWRGRMRTSSSRLRITA